MPPTRHHRGGPSTRWSSARLPSTPEVGIYQSPEPNAFATGPSRDKALVAFSTGLLQNRNEREVRAVAAHEDRQPAHGQFIVLDFSVGSSSGWRKSAIGADSDSEKCLTR